SILEGIRGRASRLASAPRFESWILRPLLEEIRKGRIQVPQRWLEHDGTDFGKKGFLGFLFPFGEFGCGGMIADGFLLLLPGGSTKFQGLIVNLASATKGLCKLCGLLLSREESVFERLLYYHEDILLCLDVYCNTVNRGRNAHDARIHLHPSSPLWMEYSFADLINFSRCSGFTILFYSCDRKFSSFFVFLRVPSWMSFLFRSLLLRDRVFRMALPDDVDDHPFAIEFRQVHVINAPLGHQLCCRRLIQHVENGDLFRRVFRRLAFFIVVFSDLDQTLECHRRAGAISVVRGRAIETEFGEFGMHAALNARWINVVDAFDVIERRLPH